MKAIITDLDRTLLHSDKTISKYTADVFNACRKKGIIIAVATARPARSVKPYQTQIAFDAITTLNGAKIITNNQIYENGISHSSGEKILSNLLEIPNVLISVETSDGIYSNIAKPEWNSTFFKGFPKLPTQGVLYKILVSSENLNSVKQIESILTADTYCTVANNSLFQIMSTEATKWKGIKIMLNSFGISENEAIYFGDDYDDIEPLRNCGVGIAVANASEEIKSNVNGIALSNDEDGVAHYIEKNVL